MFTRLAELSVHGANAQEGQIVLVGATADGARVPVLRNLVWQL